MSRTRKLAADPKVAVAYIRVSTAEQRNGLEAQRDAVQRWASHQSVEVVGWYCDTGISGAAALAERTGLLDALSALKAHRAGVLLVAKRDRIARDLGAVAAIERLTKEAGASIVTADGLDSADTPEGALVRGIIDSMAAYERALIQARTTAALRVKKIKGERVGAVPLGFAADGGGRLVPCAHEQAALLRMRELAAQGCSQPQICRVLTSEGYQPRGSKWNITTVARVLRRAV